MRATTDSLSRLQIRAIAKFIRRLLDIKEVYVDVLKFLEKMSEEFLDFNYEIVDDDELPKGEFGAFIPNCHTGESIVKIPNKVYISACGNGRTSGRDRMTIMHEIAHYILIIGFRKRPVEKLSRGSIHKSNDPEWQAMALAGEILMPFEETEHIKSPFELAHICGVSYDAAKYRIEKYAK